MWDVVSYIGTFTENHYFAIAVARFWH